MKRIIWKNEKRKLSELKPWKNNPRKASEKQRKDLERSMEKFSLADPLIINKDNSIIGGNLRFDELVKKFGKKHEVDVRVSDRKLTAKEIEELNLRLNKNVGDWDIELLMGFEENLLKDIGFDSEELDSIFQEGIKEDDFNALDAAEKIKKPKSKYGEIYQLGRHRLMCGNATKIEDVKKLMGKNLARLIFTDPPYNVNYKSPAGNSYATGKYKHKPIFNDNLSDEDCKNFYSTVLKNLYAVTTENACIYWWYATKNNWINRAAFKESKWHFSQTLIWAKNGTNLSPGQDYHRCYEPCMFGWKKGKKHYVNRKICKFKEVFNLDFEDFKLMLDFWYEKRDSTLHYEHPTQKPIRLTERALKKHSERDDIVVDVFGGSGSALLGCEQLKRSCYMMELDPVYVDVIIKRWKLFSDEKVELING